MLELSRLKIRVLPSDINFQMQVLLSRKIKMLSIRSGLANIKNIGSELAKFIVKDRLDNGKYDSIF